MRINKYIAQASGLSRRAADAAISERRVTVNNQPVTTGYEVQPGDAVTLDGKALQPAKTITIMFNKPAGYVCSRQGQGSKTIYDLLPPEFHHLKPVGRLDKNSSGLLLLTNDGNLANQLTHPSFQKQKIYKIKLNRPLEQTDFEKITKTGVNIDDTRPSIFQLSAKPPHTTYYMLHTIAWQATLTEGRNRQIRRTFAALNYTVTSLHRTHFGPHTLAKLPPGEWQILNVH